MRPEVDESHKFGLTLEHANNNGCADEPPRRKELHAFFKNAFHNAYSELFILSFGELEISGNSSWKN